MAVLFCKDKTASQLSQSTHEHSRSWIEGKDGDTLNIDLILEEEYAKLRVELDRLSSSLADVFRGASA